MYVHIFIYIHVTHTHIYIYIHVFAMLLTTPTLKVVAAATTASLYDLSARDINGQLVPLSFEGGRQGNWGQPIG
jgi:hypothetical protein